MALDAAIDVVSRQKLVIFLIRLLIFLAQSNLVFPEVLMEG